ncbi:MAG: hypothetical protein M1823_007189, partial [Watsoniomyces obsoletus]
IQQQEYQAEIDRLRTHLRPHFAEKEQLVSPIDPQDIFNEDGPRFGKYYHATFHQDGQMSTVFKARAEESSAAKVVALKVTTPSLMTPPHDSVREARLLDVCKHQAVIPLLDSFREGGRFVLVFPFLRQDLENLLRTANLTKRQSRLVFTALFEALATIHSLGIIHRDHGLLATKAQNQPMRRSPMLAQHAIDHLNCCSVTAAGALFWCSRARPKDYLFACLGAET